MIDEARLQTLFQHFGHWQISGARPGLRCVHLPRGRIKSAANADYALFKIQITTLECKDFTRTAPSQTENSPQSCVRFFVCIDDALGLRRSEEAFFLLFP